MFSLKWLSWKFLIRRAARAHGFPDPIALLGRLHRFAQPREVAAPIESLRAGAKAGFANRSVARGVKETLAYEYPHDDQYLYTTCRRRCPFRAVFYEWISKTRPPGDGCCPGV